MTDKEYLELAARALSKHLPDGHGFILLTVPVDTPMPRVQYVANINREDTIKLLKEFLFRTGEAEDWMKHIK